MSVSVLAWSPDDAMLAVGFKDSRVQLLFPATMADGCLCNGPSWYVTHDDEDEGSIWTLSWAPINANDESDQNKDRKKEWTLIVYASGALGARGSGVLHEYTIDQNYIDNNRNVAPKHSVYLGLFGAHRRLRRCVDVAYGADKILVIAASQGSSWWVKRQTLNDSLRNFVCFDQGSTTNTSEIDGLFLSPDTCWLAIMRYCSSRIDVRDLRKAITYEVRISHQPITYLAWHPHDAVIAACTEDNTVVIIADFNPALPDYTCAHHTLFLPTKVFRNIYYHASPSGLQWSPDGSLLAVVQGANSCGQISFYKLQRIIKQKHEAQISIAWVENSSDSDEIVNISWRNTKPQLTIGPVDANKLSTITTCSWSDRTHNMFHPEFRSMIFCLMCISHRFSCGGRKTLPMEIWLIVFEYLQAKNAPNKRLVASFEVVRPSFLAEIAHKMSSIFGHFF